MPLARLCRAPSGLSLPTSASFHLRPILILAQARPISVQCPSKRVLAARLLPPFFPPPREREPPYGLFQSFSFSSTIFPRPLRPNGRLTPRIPVVDERSRRVQSATAVDLPMKRITIVELLLESRVLTKTALPISFAYLLGMSTQIISMLFIGHLGTKELAGAAMGVMYTNVTGFSIGLGLATAMDTLASQAHTGSSNPHALGRIMLQSLVILIIIAVPLSLFFLYAEQILLRLGQDADVARLAGQWSVAVTPVLFSSFACECVKRFLQAQGIMHAGTYTAAAQLLINIPLLFLLVGSNPFPAGSTLHGLASSIPSLNLGFAGAPICVAISSWFYLITIGLYARFGMEGRAWQAVEKGLWSRKSVWDAVRNSKAWWGFLRLGVPGVLMIGSEWWAFELTSLMSGWLGPLTLAAHSIITATCTLTYMLPLGLAVAATNRIGNLLGAGNARGARLAAFTATGMALGVGTLNSAWLLAVRERWAYLFVGSGEAVDGNESAPGPEEVSRAVSETLPIVAGFQVNDGMAAVTGGCVRGTGHHRVGAIVNGLSYYAVGLPLGYYVAFRRSGTPEDEVDTSLDGKPQTSTLPPEAQREGLKGIWWGLFSGLMLMSVLQLVFVSRMNWAREVTNARKRVDAMVGRGAASKVAA